VVTQSPTQEAQAAAGLLTIKVDLIVLTYQQHEVWPVIQAAVRVEIPLIQERVLEIQEAAPTYFVLVGVAARAAHLLITQNLDLSPAVRLRLMVISGVAEAAAVGEAQLATPETVAIQETLQIHPQLTV
jgi:hypothetical protein